MIKPSVDQPFCAATSNPLATTLAGLKLASPLVLLSGCVGFGDSLTRVAGFSHAHVGAVILKGTTLHPCAGAAPPRLVETPAGLLNAIGLQNPGVHAVVQRILPRLDMSQTHYIANVCGGTVEEYREVSAIFNDSPIAAIELNISCPNIKAGGIHFGTEPAMAAAVTAACREVTTKPLLVKLSPSAQPIAAVAQAVIEAGADALSAINTVPGLAIDIHRRQPILGAGGGGLSGPAIRPIALRKVSEVLSVAQPAGVPVLGQGGVSHPEDAVAMLLLGARAVGLGTVLFDDPLAANRICDGLLRYLEQHGLPGLDGLCLKESSAGSLGTEKSTSVTSHHPPQ